MAIIFRYMTMQLPSQRMVLALRINCTTTLIREKYLDAYQTTILNIHKDHIQLLKLGDQKLQIKERDADENHFIKNYFIDICHIIIL